MVSKIWQKLNQSRKKLFNEHFRQRKIFKYLLILIAGLVASIAIATSLAVSETAAITYKTSWLGNSFGGGSKWVQNAVLAIHVGADGTVYTNSAWDEGGREAGIYKDGNVISLAEDLHGWERAGGKAVTANSKYIYVAMFQGATGNKDEDYPPDKTSWYCVRRYNLSGKPAPFPSGRGWDKSMLIVSTLNEVTGLAIVKSQLYVSEGGANRIHVYDLDTMKKLRSFAINNPGQIAVDKQASLWILQLKDGSAAKIVHYSQQGNQLSEQITDVAKAVAIAVDNQNRLLVADNGVRQQILIYNTKNKPSLVGTFGIKGGIYGGTAGVVENLKLYGLSAIGTDAAGNIYVNNNGFNNSGTDLRKFSPSGVMQWRLLGLQFVDNADVDPKTDGVEVYTKQEQFEMDYTKPAGKQWSYKAYTVNPFKYPQDPRLHTGPTSAFFRRIKGKPFLFLTDMYGIFMEVYRYNSATDGKIAIPSSMFVSTAEGKMIKGSWPPFQPEGEWIWRDSNGNGAFDKSEYLSSKDYPYVGGWWVDSKGDVWKTLRTSDGIRHYPLQGLDAKGNPIYTYSSMRKEKTPSIFTDLRRIEYFPDTDTMYLSGFTKEHPAIGDDWGVVGSEIVRFDNWSKGNRNPRWRTVIPYDTTGKRELSTKAMSIASDYMFAVTFKKAEVHVYKAATGKLVQKFRPGPEVASQSGWIDIPYGIRAFRRSNGEYVVFVEEDEKAKVIIYQLRG